MAIAMVMAIAIVIETATAAATTLITITMKGKGRMTIIIIVAIIYFFSTIYAMCKGTTQFESYSFKQHYPMGHNVNQQQNLCNIDFCSDVSEIFPFFHHLILIDSSRHSLGAAYEKTSTSISHMFYSGEVQQY